jgi:uncharacterized membrane protein
MSTGEYITLGICLLAILITIPIFINTIITKKWRNKVPNEEDHWKWRFIYYNRDDKRIFLPKRTGLGITFNFAQPVSIILTLAILVFLLVIIIYGLHK